MKLCFMEGCDQEAQIAIEKTISTRGQIGDSSCNLHLPFCSADHAAAFERFYPTASEQMTVIARFAANFESKHLTVEQLENAPELPSQLIDVNLGGQEMVLISREEFEELHRARRTYTEAQRKQTGCNETMRYV